MAEEDRYQKADPYRGRAWERDNDERMRYWETSSMRYWDTSPICPRDFEDNSGWRSISSGRKLEMR